jgi:hypothetical protein
VEDLLGGVADGFAGFAGGVTTWSCPLLFSREQNAQVLLNKL